MFSPAQTTKNDSAVEAAGTGGAATAAATEVATPEATPVEMNDSTDATAAATANQTTPVIAAATPTVIVTATPTTATTAATAVAAATPKHKQPRIAHRSPTDGDLLRTLPDHVLTTKVFTYFGFKDHALTGCACKYTQAHWQLENERKPLPLYVPVDCRTLEEAVKRVEHDQRITTIVLGKGGHQIDGGCLKVVSAMNIVGDPKVPKEMIVVMGGISFKEGIPGNSHLQHLTLRQANNSGVIGHSSFTMDDVLVEQCCGYGVLAYGPGVAGRCTNVEVRQCGGDGVRSADGASITLIGAKTTVHHNCTKGYSDDYGLAVEDFFSTIQLVSPLTKEQVSLDNGGGGNWGVGCEGDINQIKTITKAEMTAVLARAAASESRIDALSKQIIATGTSVVNVPEDCDLNEAVKVVHSVYKTTSAKDRRIITIVVGRGNHQIDGGRLQIFSTMNIVGDPGVAKEEIVVVGGIMFNTGIQGNCRLQNMVLTGKEGGMMEYLVNMVPMGTKNGVEGWSSFTMEDVIVRECGGDGVWAYGTGVEGRCINVEVSLCGWSGMVASSGASITLIGAETTVNLNCNGQWGDQIYGLKVEGPFSTIQLVSPLTKEQVSVDNGENWGVVIDSFNIEGINNIVDHDNIEDTYPIKTIDAPAISSSSSVAAGGAPVAGETKSNHFD